MYIIPRGIGFFYVLVGGSAMACAIELAEGFDKTNPVIFYGVHGLVVALAIGHVVYKIFFGKDAKLTPVSEARKLLFVVLTYWVAFATSQMVALVWIFIVTIVGMLLQRYREFPNQNKVVATS